MRINLYTLVLFTILFTSVGYADNPGEDENVAPEVVETSTDTATEEVVAEEEAAESMTASDADDEVVSLEKVVVTGSRIKRTQQEGALPLLVITKQDMEDSGFQSVTEALQSLPSANEYSQGESLTNTFTPNANELDLRNLGPGRILFLINGRRTADYPVPFNNAGNIVNTGIVPVGLVDRIEILSQGASAIYGSDAVSGVVNIITLQGKDFNELSIGARRYEAGGSMTQDLTFSTGGFFGSSSWTAGINATLIDPMYYEDRDGFNSFTDDPGYGSSYVAPRGGLIWYTQAGAGGANRYYGSEEFGIPCSSLNSDFFDFDKQVPEYNYTGSYPGHMCGHDYGSERFGGTSATMRNEREDMSAMVSFTHNFDNGVSFDARAYAYTDKAYYRSEVNRYLFMQGGILDPRRIGEFVATSSDPANQIPFGSVGYHQVSYFYREFSAADAPLAEARTDVDEELFDIFAGFSGMTDRGYEWSLGLNTTSYDYTAAKQTFTDKMYDYFAGVGATDADGNLLKSSYQEYLYGYAYDQATLNSYGISDPVCGWQNLYGRSSCFLTERLFGNVTNDMLSGWLADDSVNAMSEQTTIDFQISGEFELAGKFVGFAVTADHQEQEYDLTPAAGRLDDDAVDGAIVFIQGSAIDGGGKRERDSFGIELSTQLTAKTEVNFATRYDSYDDASSNVGSRQSTMLSFAYRPNEDVLVRGSFSESFRAPDMNYLFQKASSGYYNGFQDYVACYAYNEAQNLGYTDYRDCEIGSGSVQALLSGNTTLEEEEGENFQLGLVWSVSNNLNFTLDLYEIMLEKAVTREDPYTINYAEGKCTYGDAFQTFMRDEYPDRSCSDVYAKITRGPAVNDLTGAALPIGAFTQVRPAYSNQSYINYEGIDWSMDYRLETQNVGDFYFSVTSSHILKSATKFDNYSDEEDALDTYLYEPRSQQNMSIGWRYQDISMTLFTDRTGHMEAYSGYSTPSKTDPHMILNLSGNYNLNADTNIYMSIGNLENKMPQRDEAYGFPYYNRYYFGAGGRSFAAGIRYRF